MDIAEVVERSLIYYLRERVYTALPAKVINIDDLATQQTITATPLISRVYSDDVEIQPGPVYNIPVIFPSAGGGILSFPIAVGDNVLLIYSMRSIEDWMEGNGDAVKPLDTRHYHLSDAIAIPGLYNKSNNLAPNTTDAELKFAGSTIKIDPAGNIDLNSPAKVTVTAGTDVDITATGDVNITGATINLN